MYIQTYRMTSISISLLGGAWCVDNTLVSRAFDGQCS